LRRYAAVKIHKRNPDIHLFAAAVFFCSVAIGGAPVHVDSP
jgi:hypothetical protein